MKLLVVAEGETELGSSDSRDPGEGVATVLVRRLLGAVHDDALEIVPLKLSSGLRPDRQRRGEAETAELAVEAAGRQGCDGLVLFRDADHDLGRRDLALRGLAAGARAARRPIPALLGFQVRTIEAWLLADAGAYQRAFGRERPSLPRRAEELWGRRRDQDSHHPSEVFRRTIVELALPPARQAALRLAEHVDLEVLVRECPDGFGRFKLEFERAFRPFACVVAADQQNGIGKDNDLPWPRLKADLKHFRVVTSTAAATKRNAVIMGRRTWDSIPEKFRPMPDRLNVVITRGELVVPDGVIVTHSLDDALTRASLVDDIDQLFVIGGGEIFRQAFAHVRCGDVYLTRIDHTFDCDAFIPDVRDHFDLAEELGTYDDGGFPYTIGRWHRRPAP